MTYILKVPKQLWTARTTKTGKHQGARCNLTWQEGFTLIELMIVLSILAILTTIAVPSYQRHLIKAREAVLAEDLFQVRQAIDKFFADNLHYPDNLEELVSARYLRQLPEDPFTRSDKTWQITPPQTNDFGETEAGSVYDIASGSDLIGLNGVPYKEW